MINGRIISLASDFITFSFNHFAPNYSALVTVVRRLARRSLGKGWFEVGRRARRSFSEGWFDVQSLFRFSLLFPHRLLITAHGPPSPTS